MGTDPVTKSVGKVLSSVLPKSVMPKKFTLVHLLVVVVVVFMLYHALTDNVEGYMVDKCFPIDPSGGKCKVDDGSEILVVDVKILKNSNGTDPITIAQFAKAQPAYEKFRGVVTTAVNKINKAQCKGTLNNTNAASEIKKAKTAFLTVLKDNGIKTSDITSAMTTGAINGLGLKAGVDAETVCSPHHNNKANCEKNEECRHLGCSMEDNKFKYPALDRGESDGIAMRLYNECVTAHDYKGYPSINKRQEQSVHHDWSLTAGNTGYITIQPSKSEVKKMDWLSSKKQHYPELWETDIDKHRTWVTDQTTSGGRGCEPDLTGAPPNLKFKCDALTQNSQVKLMPSRDNLGFVAANYRKGMTQECTSKQILSSKGDMLCCDGFGTKGALTICKTHKADLKGPGDMCEEWHKNFADTAEALVDKVGLHATEGHVAAGNLFSRLFGSTYTNAGDGGT